MSEDSKDENQKDPKLECKVVLLGETMTGKTSLISRLVDNTFNYNEMTTFVASNQSKEFVYSEFGGVTLTLQIWDTAGQEKFRSINKIFYKDASIAILVYDITRRETFDDIRTYWINQLNQYGKSDLSMIDFIM